MKKKTIITIGMTALLLTAVIGTTLALLSARTDEKKNVFSVGQGITGELKEPMWDGENFTDTNNTGEGVISNKVVGVPAAGEQKLGAEIAKSYYPGSSIPKDPAVANTSKVDTWIAVTIDYAYYDRTVVKNTDGTETVNISTKKNNAITGKNMFLDASTKFAKVDFNSNDWEFNADYTVAYYKKIVPAGKKTSTVFNSVTIDKLATLTDKTDATKMLGISSFEINLQGYLVQALGIDDLASAKTELDQLISESTD